MYYVKFVQICSRTICERTVKHTIFEILQQFNFKRVTKFICMCKKLYTILSIEYFQIYI